VTASELTHYQARERFGLPDEIVGSVNDPRTREENGVRWNEKWIYRLEHGGERVIYWHRYDCRGVFLKSAHDGARREAL
jgi:hypothetical protein